MTPLNSLTNGSLGGNFDEMSRAPLSFLISIPRYMALKSKDYCEIIPLKHRIYSILRYQVPRNDKNVN